MTVEELTNIFLRLDMAGKAEDSEFLFGSSEDGVDPFPSRVCFSMKMVMCVWNRM